MIVVELVADKNRAVRAVPEHEVAVARLPGVEPHEVGIDALVVESGLHVAADLVAPDVRGDRCGQAKTRKADGGVGGIAARLHRECVVEWDLPAEGEVHPVSVLVLPEADMPVGQADEDIGRCVAHAQHVQLRHADM